MLLDLEVSETSTRSCAFTPEESDDRAITGDWTDLAAAAQALGEREISQSASPETAAESARKWIAVWSCLDVLAYTEQEINVAFRFGSERSEPVPDLMGIFGGEADGPNWGMTTSTEDDRASFVLEEESDEATSSVAEEPTSHYPLLTRAIRSGRITGRGLPKPGSRTLRLVEDYALTEAEQISFGATGAAPPDHVRRPRR